MTPPPLESALVTDFFIPGIDKGFELLSEQDLGPHRTDAVHVEGLPLASDVEQRLRLVHELSALEKRIWNAGIVFPTVLGVADDVCFFDQHMAITGKYFISSAGGSRLRIRYAKIGPKHGDADPDAALVAHIASESFRNRHPLPVATDDMRHLPFVMECRNYFNFYHFLKEVFPLLTLAVQHELTGPIIFVARGAAEPVTFVRDLIHTWFPELASRVELAHAPQTFERAIVALDTRHFYYQCRDRLMPSIDGVSDEPVGRRATGGNMHTVSMNSCESPVPALRARVLDQLEERRSGSVRLYVKRRSARNRRVVGEEALEERLETLGFTTVYFEDMTVREQAQTVSDAECIVSLHGAGLANMLFVPRHCLVVELSNLQTMLKRQGDFHPLALASGARYLHVYLDHDHPDVTLLPSIADDGHRGVRISGFDAAVIASLIHSRLEAGRYAAEKIACRALNDRRRLPELSEALQVAEDILFHDPDWHVWQANTFSETGDKARVLHHLRHAMVLAPRRVPLLKRVMTVARSLNERQTFLEATACFMQCAAQKCDSFLRENGWDIEEATPEL